MRQPRIAERRHVGGRDAGLAADQDTDRDLPGRPWNGGGDAGGGGLGQMAHEAGGTYRRPAFPHLDGAERIA